MGLQSALTTALTGMRAAEASIDVVGNNVANSNTVGFKESSVNFATQFLQTQSVGGGPTENSGGTNPRQVGLGVKVAEISPNFTQGTIEISSNPLDVAIQGDGFLIVQGPQGAGQQFFTRNGQLKTNANNEIVTATGFRLLGFGVNDQNEIQTGVMTPLTIPFGASAVAQETENATLTGNLLPLEEIGDIPGILSSVVLNNNSIEAPGNLDATDLGQLQAPQINVTFSTNSVLATDPSVDPGTYNYKIVFVDPSAPAGFQEISPSSATDNIVVGTDETVTLNNLPTTSDTSLTSKNIYRLNSSGDYQLVDTVPASQASYTDSTDNASLGATLDERSLDKVNYSYFVTFYNSTNGFESRPTAETVGISITDANRRIRLNNLPNLANPADNPSGFDSIRIFRNVENQPENFYNVVDLPLGATTFIDNIPDSEILSNDLVDQNGPAISTSLELVNVSTFDGSKYVDLFKEGTLSFNGNRGTATLASKELEVTSTTTVQELIDFMEQSMGIHTFSPDLENPIPGSPGGSINGLSQLEFTSNLGEANELDISLSAFQFISDTGPPESVPLSFTQTQQANGEGATLEFVAYDSLGAPVPVRVSMVLESRNSSSTTYRWYANSPDNQPVDGVGTTLGTGLITFDSFGRFFSSTESTVQIERRDVASSSPVEFDLDFSQITSVDKQSEPSSLSLASQDGFAAGSLTSFSITDSGLIKGTYSNGTTRDIGQIQMARFTNNGGLEQLGNNLFASGVNSGEPFIGSPGDSGLGALTAGAVELSNTDIGQNLIELILSSTQYRGGARVISAVQELLDELLALRR